MTRPTNARAGPATSDGSAPVVLVEQPTKLVRIGSMVKQLLEEVRTAPLDEASRERLRRVHLASVAELEDGLAPELSEELDRLARPLGSEPPPSVAELRVAQAQLVGWVEGVFHGLQITLFLEQMEARAQLGALRGATQEPVEFPTTSGTYL